MKISTKGRYAVRIMIDLAVHNTGEFIPLKEISDRQDVSVKYLEQIISMLSKAGYLRSLRGNGGGYMLSRKPEDYTIGEILRTSEGSLTPVACLDDNPNMCKRSSCCSVLPFWQGLSEAINNYVDSVTLAELAENERKNSGNDYVI